MQIKNNIKFNKITYYIIMDIMKKGQVHFEEKDERLYLAVSITGKFL